MRRLESTAEFNRLIRKDWCGTQPKAARPGLSWNFVRTNTISGVVHAAEKLMPGRRTRDAEPARQAIIQIAIRLELLPLGPGAQNGRRWAFAQKTSIPCRLHFQS